MEFISSNRLLLVVLSILVILNCTVATDCQVAELETEHHYYVHQDGDNTSCPDTTNEICEDLSFYIENKEDYFNSSTTFYFLDGLFRHESNFTIENVTNLTMVGKKGNSTIDCSGSDNAGFEFISVTGLHIENLKVYNCGQVMNFGHGDMHSALGCNNGRDHFLFNVEITHSRSQNVYYGNLEGNLRICGSTFAHTANTYYFAGNAFFFSKCNSQDMDFLIENSTFFNNTNKQKRHSAHLQFASGLLIVLKCTNVNVTIDNAIINQNEGFDGGNMAIVFHNVSHVFTSPVHVKNSNITNGRAEIGGGIFTTFVEASLQMNQTCTPTTVPRTLLLLTNVTFTGNEAKIGGGGLYLRPKESQTYCSVGRIIVQNCTFKNNAIKSKAPGGVAIHNTNYVALPYLQHAMPQYHLEIIDTEFSDHHVKSPSGKGVIFAKASPHVGLKNVWIHDNNCSGILGVSSNFIISGNVTISNNRASSGGGMLFCSDSVMFLTPYTNLTIKNNNVTHAGGGICIEILCLQSRPMCFFQLDNSTLITPKLIDTIHVKLENNTAVYAGHGLFGGSVEYCFLLDSPLHEGQANKSKPVFEKVFKITPELPSSNASPPLRVCTCNLSNETQWCFPPKDIKQYPGETFTLPLVVVGQYNGTVPGTVEAKLEHHHNYSLGSRDSSQSINDANCTQVSYTVFTNAKQATLLLRVGIVGDESFVEHLKEFTSLPVNIILKKCPIGFQLSQREYRYCCQCSSVFNRNHNIHCNITSKTITTSNAKKPVWIGYSNDSETYLISNSLAFDYSLSDDTITINVSDVAMDQDIQCQNYRTGILCGACRENYSIILGSSECRNDCTGSFLSLVLVFAFAGIILVFILSFLNLTVAEGTVNGLIFYVNIVQIHRAIFFQYHRINTLTTGLLLFVSWINLDLGIPVCFYKGMNEYAKAWLQFLFPLYVWALSCIIILLSRRFNSFAKLFGSNGVKVLATLILLSYTKMLRTIISTAHYQIIEHYNATGNGFTHVLHWKPDANILFLHGKHIPLFSIGLLFMLICLPFTFILLCIQNLQKVSTRRCFTWVARLKPFFDAFTGPYSKHARFWTGLLLLTRCILYTISATNYYDVERTNIFVTVLACIILFVVAWTLKPGIYEKRSLNLLECSFLFNLSVLCTGTAFTVYNNHKGAHSLITHVSVLIAFITFLGILLYHGFKQIACYLKMRKSRAAVPTMTVTVDVTTTAEVTTSKNNNSSPLENPLAKFPPFVCFDQDREPLLAPDDEERDSTIID